MALDIHPTSPYRVLARLYRPQRLSELIGQEALARTLTNAFASGRIAHAFLLSGIRGVGKTTTARIIARGLNCVGPDGKGGPTPEPCGACGPCRMMSEDRPLDVIEMDAATRTGIDDIREIVDSVRYAPAAARYKVYIIDEVHMLSEKAFNGLLKTLEEPPPHAKFVFATTEVRKVPVTVLSRCQRFDLRRVEPAVLTAHLARIAERESITVSETALALIASVAEGSVRDSLSLLDQAMALGDGRIEESDVQEMLGLGDRARLVELWGAVLGGDAAGALAKLRDLYACGADPASVVQDLLALAHMQSRLVAGAGLPEGLLVLGSDLKGRVRSMAERLSLPVLARAWQMLLRGLEEVRSAPNALAAAEMVLIRLAAIGDLPAPAELARWLRGEAPLPAQATTGPRPRIPTSPSPLPAPVSAAPASAGPAVPVRAVSNGSGNAGGTGLTAPAGTPVVRPASVAATPARSTEPQSFAELVERLRGAGDAALAAYLHEGAHLIRFEPGRIELRPAPHLPPDVASRLAEGATRLTGRRWIVIIGQAQGEPTLSEQARARKAERLQELASDSKLRRVLDAFPGAAIVDVRSDRPS